MLLVLAGSHPRMYISQGGGKSYPDWRAAHERGLDAPSRPLHPGCRLLSQEVSPASLSQGRRKVAKLTSSLPQPCHFLPGCPCARQRQLCSQGLNCLLCEMGLACPVVQDEKILCEPQKAAQGWGLSFLVTKVWEIGSPLQPQTAPPCPPPAFGTWKQDPGCRLQRSQVGEISSVFVLNQTLCKTWPWGGGLRKNLCPLLFFFLS